MAEKTLLDATTALLGDLGIAAGVLTNGDLPVASPIDGSRIATIRSHSRQDLDGMIALAERAFLAWREISPRGAASWCGCLPNSFGSTRRRPVGWCRSRQAKSSRKAEAKCRI